MKTKSKKPNPKVREILVPTRVNATEMSELIKRAMLYFPTKTGKPNVSKLLRVAGLEYVQKRGAK